MQDLDFEKLELNFDKIRNLPDFQERVNLCKSWVGQAEKCQRKGHLQDEYYFALGQAWMEKVNKLLEGYPLEECKGKIKVKGAKPMSKKQRVAWKKENKSTIKAYRKKVQADNERRQKEGNRKPYKVEV